MTARPCELGEGGHRPGGCVGCYHQCHPGHLGPTGLRCGPQGVSLPRSPTRSSLAPGQHLAHLPFLGPHLLLMLFEIVKKSCVKLCREKCVVLPDM